MIDLLFSNMRFIEEVVDNSYIKYYKNYLFYKKIVLRTYPNADLINYFEFIIVNNRIFKIRYIVKNPKQKIVYNQILVDYNKHIFLFKVSKNVWKTHKKIIFDFLNRIYFTLEFKTVNLGII